MSGQRGFQRNILHGIRDYDGSCFRNQKDKSCAHSKRFMNVRSVVFKAEKVIKKVIKDNVF